MSAAASFVSPVFIDWFVLISMIFLDTMYEVMKLPESTRVFNDTLHVDRPTIIRHCHHARKVCHVVTNQHILDLVIQDFLISSMVPGGKCWVGPLLKDSKMFFLSA